MFSCMKCLMASLSLLTFGWAAELAPVGSAEEIIDGHASSAGFISAAAIAEISPEVAERASSTEYATLDTVFERVIGLGRNCLTKGQINLFFNPQNSQFQTKSGKADLFDWMEIFDYDLFLKALSNKFENFFKKEDFAINGSSHYELRDLKHGIRWVHILEKYLESTPKEHKCDPEYLLSVFYENFDQEKAKIDYLVPRFINAKSKKTLYVISYSPILPHETLINIRNALIDIRDGDTQFALLFVSENQGQENFENIIMREASNVNSGWEVKPDPVRWGEILSEFKFTPDIWA